MDWNYKVTAKKIGWEIDLHAGDNISSFPIERARARLAWLWSIIQCGSIIGYGWAVQNRVVSQFQPGDTRWHLTLDSDVDKS
jgi:hypothetical protein